MKLTKHIPGGLTAIAHDSITKAGNVMGFLPAWQYKADACSTMLKSVVNDYIPNYKEHLELEAIKKHLAYDPRIGSSRNKSTLIGDKYLGPTDEAIEKFETFANRNVPKYESFSDDAKIKIRTEIENFYDKLTNSRVRVATLKENHFLRIEHHLDEPEWSPEQINRVSEVIKKCNQHLGGLEHLVHDSEPLIQAVLNCHIRHDGYDTVDYGMMEAKLIRRPEETVPVILNRLSQVVLNHLPRDDIAPDDAKFMLDHLKYYGKQIIYQAYHLEELQYKKEVENPSRTADARRLFNEHFDQKYASLEEAVNSLLTSAQMSLTSDLSQTVSMKETSETPVFSTEPSV